MPVTFSPAKHSAEPFDPRKFPTPSAKENGGLASYILKEACYQQSQQLDEILQSSFDNMPVEGNDHHIVPKRNGFVDTVLCAYNNHHALIIRPDDVWLAILVQFSSFINANAEDLRSQFVRHKGKKELTVESDRRDVDYAQMAEMLTAEIEKNIVEPSLRAWVLPNFNTTTSNDTTVCSIVMMASMKKYFDYKVFLMCGIPRVTLDGEKEDWQKILERLERLKEYGLEMITWYHLLRPIFARFVKAFDVPNAEENLDFWQKVAHYEGGGSGPTYLCGWITAFCVFNDEGQWLGNKIKQGCTIHYTKKSFVLIKIPEIQDTKESSEGRSLSTKDFFSTYIDTPDLPENFTYFSEKPDERACLQLDSARYHIIDSSDVPSGYSEVDVLLDDNGNEYQCMMVAGAVGMRFRPSRGSGSALKDTVEPVAGWWMFTKKSEARVQDEEREEHNSLFSGLAAMQEQLNDSEEDTDHVEGPDSEKVEKRQEDTKGAGCCNCLVM